MHIVTRIVIGLALVAATVVALPGCADKQVASNDAAGKSETFGAGKIKISGYLVDLFYVIDNDIFLCTPIEEPRTLGVVLDAIGSADQTWSVRATSLSNGARTVRYPIFGDVRTANGERRVLVPATLNVKIDIPAGQVLHTKDPLVFDITATRSIKAGESLSVIFINGKNDNPSILSVETANGAPVFTAFLRSDNPGARRAAIEAWRIESDLAQQ
jgi:hypothetical protein